MEQSCNNETFIFKNKLNCHTIQHCSAFQGALMEILCDCLKLSSWKYSIYVSLVWVLLPCRILSGGPFLTNYTLPLRRKSRNSYWGFTLIDPCFPLKFAIFSNICLKIQINCLVGIRRQVSNIWYFLFHFQELKGQKLVEFEGYDSSRGNASWAHARQ